MLDELFDMLLMICLLRLIIDGRYWYFFWFFCYTWILYI